MIDQLLGQLVDGKYRIESFMRLTDLGRMCNGRHVSMDRPVTIEVLEPGLAADEWAVEQFTARAKSLSKVSHPNVLNVTDFGSDRGTHYIVYEHADGQLLQDSMRSEGRFPVKRAAEIARQIAAGLSAAHAGGVLHRAISPANILLSTGHAHDEHVKIFDFGSAERGAENAGNGESPPQRNAAYSAPEQLAESVDADERSDIYGTGLILFEMLAGERPFAADNLPDIIRKTIEEPPPPLISFRSDLPPSLEPVILKALAKDPDMRYQTAAEFVDALDEATQGTSAAAAAASGNDIWKTAFVVLVGISLLAAVLVYATSSRRTDPATALQADANGLPVQPINPATGTQEDALANMQGMSAEVVGNSNMMMPPGTMPGGDGYNPWAGGVQPPPGGPPTYIGPGGQVITIDPATGSPFMSPDGSVILVPVPANTNSAVKPTPTPKTPAANANSQTPPDTKASPTPAAKASPTAPRATPSRPAATPATTPKPDAEEN